MILGRQLVERYYSEIEEERSFGKKSIRYAKKQVKNLTRAMATGNAKLANESVSRISKNELRIGNAPTKVRKQIYKPFEKGEAIIEAAEQKYPTLSKTSNVTPEEFRLGKKVLGKSAGVSSNKVALDYNNGAPVPKIISEKEKLSKKALDVLELL